MSQLTQAKLKELLHYDPATGIFTWVCSPSRGVKQGDIAGSLTKDGYMKIKINGIHHQSHRLAWLITQGEFPENQIDHINHIRNDNRITNLREVTQSENLRNAALSKNNTSGVCGVYWNKENSKWRSNIRVNKKLTSLGYFTYFIMACAIRKSAELEYNYHENHGAAV